MSEMELPEDVQEVEDIESQSVEEDSADDSTVQPEPKRQPEQSERKRERINLDELPEFRQWKSTQDRKLAELERKARMAEEAALTRMTDPEKQKYQQQTLQQRLEETERELQQQRQMNEWITFVEGVRSKTGDPPLQELDQSSPHALMESAYEWKTRQLEQRYKSERRQQRAQANAVDTGKSGPNDPAELKWQKQYDEARSSFDTRRMLEIVNEAQREGVILNEYVPPL